MSTFRQSPLNLLLTVSLLLSMSMGFLTPVSAQPISETSQTNIESQPAAASPAIHDITTNAADYPDGKIPRYEKFEITFQVNTEAKNLQMPYDPETANPNSSNYVPGLADIATTGINVDAEFTSPEGEKYSVPGFYYQEFDHQVKDNKDWIYPTGTYNWKIRFAPNQVGNWSYTLLVKDSNGDAPPAFGQFAVVSSANHGFVQVSEKDSRYFEFEDGTYFPGLGYNMNFDQISWNNPILENQSNFETMSANGIQLIRMWLSQWGIYGSAWNPWNTITSGHSNYIPQEALTFDPGKVYPGHELAMNIWYPGAYPNPCMFLGFMKASPAIKPGTSYMLSVTYKFTNDNNIPIVKDKASGFVVKLGGWLKGDGNDCYLPNTGEVIAASYPPPPDKLWETVGAVGDWQTTTAIWENKGGLTFLPNLYVALENVSSGAAYIDEVTLREVGAAGPSVNVISSPRMDHHLDMDQRFSFAFDKVLEMAKANNVYLRPVLMEKGEWIFNHINHTGNYTKTVAADNEYFYGDYRNVTKVRWLQRAWWRYAQARWGYSTNIQSWELLNEGSLGNARYKDQAEVFGEFMHCGVFGVAVDLNTRECQTNNANDHLVTTSFWYSFPRDGFWANSAYPNIDYADIHQYIPEKPKPSACGDSSNPYCNADPNFYDSAMAHYEMSMKYGAKQPDGAGKPVIRGETGFTDIGDGPATTKLASDTQGVGLHKFIWAGISPGGLLESYWNVTEHIYPKGVDFRPLYKAFSNFIFDIPLNNGRYEDAKAATSTTNLIAWGQKDLAYGRAHLWINNKNHTWWNVVSQISIPLVSGTVDITGFQPGASYLVQRWKTNRAKDQIEATTILVADGNGKIRIEVTNLQSDFAVKIYPYTTSVKVNSTADPGDGICTTSECTLREAVILANTIPGPMTIEVPSGVYVLSAVGANEDTARTGDLDLTDEVTIVGADRMTTIIDGNSDNVESRFYDRVFEIRGTKVELKNLTVRNGDGANGTGIRNGFGQVTLDNSIVMGNGNLSKDAFGIVNAGGIFTVTHSHIVNNGSQLSSAYGGGIDNDGGFLTIESSLVSSNIGVGVENPNTLVTVLNSTISKNTSHGIRDYAGGNEVVTNSTIVDNNGAGISTVDQIHARLRNTILAGNQKGNCLFETSTANVVSLGHNLDSDGTCKLTAPGDKSNLDPKLGPLQDNGGSTPTHALLSNSPAIDAGDDSSCPNTDQRDLPRPKDGNGDGTASCDIGAFEAQNPPEGVGKIIIIKKGLPYSPRNFHYFGPWGDFYLDDPGEDDGDAIKNSMHYSEVSTPGTYTFSEEKVANWFLDSITCNLTDRVTLNLPQRSVTIRPQPGETVICTFINKYAASLSVLSYWDMDQDGQHDPTEDRQNGWWTEFYDSSGTIKASNFTQNGGHWDLYNIRPGTYTVCQKPQDGWYNTKPIITDPAHNNWPCYTFDLSYAQMAKTYFAYSDQPFVANADKQSTQSGLEIIQVSDPEQDALATWEEFLAVHPGDRLPDEDEAKTNIYLPVIVR